VRFPFRFPLAAALLPLGAAAALGQGTLIPTVPFAPPPHAVSPAGTSQTRLAAAEAQAIGLPSVAVSLYREALRAPGADRNSLELALAGALLDEGLPAEADAALQAAPDHGSAAWHLRRGLAAAALRRIDQAKSEMLAVHALDLSPADLPWFLFLQGTVAALTGQPPAPRPEQLLAEAAQRARSSLARARFLLAAEEQRLRLGPVSEDSLAQAKQTAATFAGQALGYDYARTYAVMLQAAGRKAEAIAALQADLLTVPAAEKARADDFRLLLGLIGGAGAGAGRTALIQLLETGADEERRRVALQLLAAASAAEPAHAEFRGLLDRMLADPANARSSLQDDLLLYRANLAVDDGASAQAQAFAERLLTNFPGSPLRPYILAVQARAAWNQQRFRTAADFAAQAQSAYDWADGKALFGVVVAEAWFRAGDRAGDAADFRNAANAYAAAVRNRPSGMPAGELMFQRVEAEIRAGEMKRAADAIGEMAHDPEFDVTNRWRAEYNLIRELRLRNEIAAADDRVSRVLREPRGPGAPPELHARMLWLQVQLAHDAGNFAGSLSLARAVRGNLGRVPEPLRTQVAAQCALLAAEDLFALGREPEAVAALKQLRQDYPRDDAASESRLVEAAQYARQDRTAEAEQLLIRLAEESPQSRYADQALFQAAVLAKSLGQTRDFEQAIKLLEQLITNHPDSPLFFDARMEEGNVFRLNNELDLAQQTYQSLVNNPGSSPDLVLAQLALADCDAALGSGADADQAAAIYQELLDRQDLQKRADGTDLRVEAGYKLGALLRRRGRTVDAQNVWFDQVMHPFLLDPARAAELGTGRYWMARTVLDLGDLLLGEGKTDEASSAWRQVLQTGLPGAELARTKLAQLAPAAPR
jgi:TolA-binding protein